MLAYFLKESALYFLSLCKRGRPVEGGQRTSRFAFELNKIRKNPNFAHFRLFVPSHDAPNELSVSLTSDLHDLRVWPLGDSTGKGRGKKAIARADLRVSTVSSTNLAVVHAVPPRRHALFVGWASIEKQKSIAQVLALKATLVTR